ncbi:MAG: hemerythrin domain-containing protein [Thermodesulfobacteriota bacterium]|jgi:hemerythrin-like domain-containing protein
MTEHIHSHVERATEVLKHEHRLIERALDVLERALVTLEQDRPADKDLLGKVTEFFKGFVDACHHKKEEQALFPRIAARGVPIEGGPIGVMLSEHDEGRGYIHGLAEGVTLLGQEPGQAKRLIYENGRRYIALLRTHIQKEDNVLFALADRCLTAKDQHEVVRRFEETERQGGEGRHERFVNLIEELERLAPGSV